MSKASAVGQITVISNGTSYNAFLQCQLGDIVQTYQGNIDAPENITPNYEASGAEKPIIMLMLFSSEKGNGNALSNVSNDKVTWFINTNIQIKFDGSTNLSTNSFGGETGHFLKTTYTISNGSESIVVPALKVMKNLVKINGGSSFTISASCIAPVTNTSVQLEAYYQVFISTAADVTKKVSIAAADTHPFTILTKKGTCEVKALVDGAETSSSDYSYVWKLFRNGEWTEKAAVDGKPNHLIVSEEEVDTFGLVKVEVSKGGALYGSDIATVSDKSDPYTIYPNPKEVVYDSSGNDTDKFPDDYTKGDAASETFTVNDGRVIRYKPILKPESANQDKTQTYKMYLYDVNGNPVKDYTTAAKHFDIKNNEVASFGTIVYIIQTSD